MKSLCFAKRARNLALFVWSSCHCGCQREGRGGCPVSSFGTLVKTQKKRYLEHDDLISHTTLLQYVKNPRLQHSPSDSVIISTHKAQFLTFYSLP